MTICHERANVVKCGSLAWNGMHNANGLKHPELHLCLSQFQTLPYPSPAPRQPQGKFSTFVKSSPYRQTFHQMRGAQASVSAFTTLFLLIPNM